jgi:hypothetical protein
MPVDSLAPLLDLRGAGHPAGICTADALGTVVCSRASRLPWGVLLVC